MRYYIYQQKIKIIKSPTFVTQSMFLNPYVSGSDQKLYSTLAPAVAETFYRNTRVLILEKFPRYAKTSNTCTK